MSEPSAFVAFAATVAAVAGIAAAYLAWKTHGIALRLENVAAAAQRQAAIREIAATVQLTLFEVTRAAELCSAASARVDAQAGTADGPLPNGIKTERERLAAIVARIQKCQRDAMDMELEIPGLAAAPLPKLAQTHGNIDARLQVVRKLADDLARDDRARV